MTDSSNIVHLQVTSGRGPAQCQWVVAQVVAAICDEAQAQGIAADVVARSPGSHEGTLSSAIVALTGGSVEAFCRGWVGTIQWIGKNQFRQHHRRNNWFVGVRECPTPEETEIDIRSDDLVVETMRGSGPGGQHINRREMAVRIRHLPTGVVVTAREGRSQKENLARARERLRRVLGERQDAAAQSQRQEQWHQHDTLTRGEAIRVYTGVKFRRQT